MGVAVKGAPPSNFRALIDFGVISNLTLDYNHMTGNFHQGREVIQWFFFNNSPIIVKGK